VSFSANRALGSLILISMLSGLIPSDIEHVELEYM